MSFRQCITTGLGIYAQTHTLRERILEIHRKTPEVARKTRYFAMGLPVRTASRQEPDRCHQRRRRAGRLTGKPILFRVLLPLVFNYMDEIYAQPHVPGRKVCMGLSGISLVKYIFINYIEV